LEDEERRGAVHELPSVAVVELEGVVVVLEDCLREGVHEAEVRGDHQDQGIVLSDGQFALALLECLRDEAVGNLH
jgi:hypothetical protein